MQEPKVAVVGHTYAESRCGELSCYTASKASKLYMIIELLLVVE